jgi:hypothetical protein
MLGKYSTTELHLQIPNESLYKEFVRRSSVLSTESKLLPASFQFGTASLLSCWPSYCLSLPTIDCKRHSLVLLSTVFHRTGIKEVLKMYLPSKRWREEEHVATLWLVGSQSKNVGRWRKRLGTSLECIWAAGMGGSENEWSQVRVCGGTLIQSEGPGFEFQIHHFLWMIYFFKYLVPPM